MPSKQGDRVKDIKGEKFFRLTAIDSFSKRNPSGRSQVFWNCICDCGEKVQVLGECLRRGTTKSCGCWKEEKEPTSKTHGMSQSDEYKIYRDIVRRCEDPRRKGYKHYGGVGIKCEWDSFEDFYEQMGPRPSPEHSVERKDAYGNYCKANCVWTNDNNLQAFNQKIRKSKTGIPGVRPDGQGYGYVVSIGVNYEKIYLGFFKSLREAAQARKDAEVKYYGFNLKWELPDE